MRYIVDVDGGHSDRMKELIRKKQYESVAQFISVAIENQLYLENTNINDKLQSHNKISVEEKHHDRNGFPQDSVDINISIETSKPKTVEVPDLDKLISFPNDIEIGSCWLWGQINRVFPIKLGLRILLSKLEKETWIELEEFKEKAGLIASKYRQMIDNSDEAQKLNTRAIAAGLPIYYTNNVDKLKVENSLNRYKNQFLAYVRTDGKLDGALNQLRFTNVKKERKGNYDNYSIGITSQGLKFAKLPNPIIDNKNINKTLSKEEVDFYINHIKEYNKGEYAATIWLLKKLDNGISKREEINSELQKDYNTKWVLKDEVVNTQRAGLMARMSELGLIDKIKKGIKVKYMISDYGKEVLNNR